MRHWSTFSLLLSTGCWGLPLEPGLGLACGIIWQCTCSQVSSSWDKNQYFQIQDHDPQPMITSCPKSSSSIIFGSCSWVREEYSGKLWGDCATSVIWEKVRVELLMRSVGLITCQSPAGRHQWRGHNKGRLEALLFRLQSRDLTPEARRMKKTS